MSAETAILLELRSLRADVAATQRQLDLIAGRLAGAADRLTTAEACAYARCSRTQLYRWRGAGAVTYHEGPRPWSRDELDQVLRGLPPPTETRGRRRSS